MYYFNECRMPGSVTISIQSVLPVHLVLNHRSGQPGSKAMEIYI